MRLEKPVDKSSPAFTRPRRRRARPLAPVTGVSTVAGARRRCSLILLVILSGYLKIDMALGAFALR
jgi:hypothetical protein